MSRFRPCIAEAVGTFALIFVGVGAIKAAGSDLLAVAFAHGLTIAVMSRRRWPSREGTRTPP